MDVHIPETFGGVEGETVYIDTEGSLVIDRLVEIAKSAVAHCNQVAASQGWFFYQFYLADIMVMGNVKKNE